jgi:hypothetical protein
MMSVSAAMTSEQRLDRLERIAKLFVKAGVRARRQMREQGEKIDILINMHIENEVKFADQGEKINMLINLQEKNEERFARNEERFARNEERFAKHEKLFARSDRRFAAFTKAHGRTMQRLDSLIVTLRRARN